MLGALVALVLAIALVADFDAGAAGLQHVVDESWIPDLGVRYQLGVDGISIFLVLLTAVLWFAATLWSALRTTPERPRAPTTSCSALAQTAPLGAFLAQDLLLFVLFFDLMLIPFFFLIGTFGGAATAIAATTKMIVYTLVGSLLMLVAAIATAILAPGSVGELTFSIPCSAAPAVDRQPGLDLLLLRRGLPGEDARLPVHGWMPDAYRAAPLPVLILLSGVLSKVGAYGFLRVVLPLFPAATAHFQELMLLIARRLDPLRLGDGVHPDEHPADRRLLVDRPARLHHPRDLQPAPRRRRRRGAPDGQPRARRGRRSS